MAPFLIPKRFLPRPCKYTENMMQTIFLRHRSYCLFSLTHSLEFKRCPQSFLFQYLYGLKQPTSLALCKGSMCHAALEKVFDLEPQDRTLEHLQNLFRSVWSEHRMQDGYRQLFETTTSRDLQAEGNWGRESLQLLENYYSFEDPRSIPRPNPIQREIWVKAHLSLDSRLGATGYVVPKDYETANPDNDAFLVRGIVDRLDMIRVSPYQVALRIVDYKTGKAPNLKYSATMNQKIAEEAFYQLKIYALLLREKGADIESLDLRYLRLLYLTSESGQAKSMDMDLGETEEERDRLLQDIHADLSSVWTSIVDLVSQQDPKAFVGCDRSFCYCHKCRERFVPGTLWEP